MTASSCLFDDLNSSVLEVPKLADVENTAPTRSTLLNPKRGISEESTWEGKISTTVQFLARWILKSLVASEADGGGWWVGMGVSN